MGIITLVLVILSLALVGVVAYSLLVRQHVQKVFTTLVNALFIFAFLIGLQSLLGLLNPLAITGSLVTGLLLAWLFQPLENAAQWVVDRLILRRRYNYRHILEKYTYALSRPMTDLNRFANIAPYLLTKSLELFGSSFMTLDRSSASFVVRAGEKGAAQLTGTSLPASSPLIQLLEKRQKELYLVELERSLKNPGLPEQEKSTLQAAVAEMKKLEIVLIVPIVSEGQHFQDPTVLAAINLGRKMSGRGFSPEDLDFLNTLARQTTLSLEYAFILEELKKHQAQILAAEKMAVLGNSCAGIAHELKNPLTYLLTVGQSLASNWDKPTFKESLINMLPSEIERMKLIIDGLSDYSKSHELRLEETEIPVVIDKVLAVLGYEIKKNNITVSKKYPAEKVTARADKNRLVQVFLNLIANAVQAMEPKGGGSLNLVVQNEAKQVKVSVSDTGPGIPPENLQRIFDPFFTTKEAGTGLGLSITKKIVDEHQGKLTVESALGKGTVFVVHLPKVI